jgi:hypothetical protein
MLAQQSTRRSTIVLFAFSLTLGMFTYYGWADEGHNHGDGHNHAQGAQAAGQHGGQVAKTKDLCLEVVYQPKETRIYLYDHAHKHLSARGITGEALMQIRGNDKVYRFPAKYVAGTNQGDHDYLAVFADLSGVRDGDMQVTMHLENLPATSERTAHFTQTFALAKLNVSVAQLAEADRNWIARQQVCPVMGTKLGSHGMPVKMLVGDQPLYLCCKGCIRKVEADPQTYLAKVSNPRGN